MNYIPNNNLEPSSHILVLASGSHSRRSLLKRLGLTFSVTPANIDETPETGERPRELVSRLSRQKALAVRGSNPNAFIIGSDQVALFEGRASSKPNSIEGAIDDLTKFSGRSVEFLTGLCLDIPGNNQHLELCDRTVVHFRELCAEEIRRYVEIDKPIDCAGSFRLESLGPSLFERVDSTDPTALLGLPLIGLCRLLRQAGWLLP